MKHSVIQYSVKDGLASENEKLINDVFAQLKAEQPDGITYAVYKTGDSSFMHMISFDNDETNAKFTEMEAFKAFRTGIKDRVEAKPVLTEVRRVGSYKAGKVRDIKDKVNKRCKIASVIIICLLILYLP